MPQFLWCRTLEKGEKTMSLVKRGTTWHCHFVVDGIRYRESLKTTDWREAQKRERDAIEKARAGKLAAKHKATALLTFKQAAEQFVTDPARDLKPLSVRTEKERMRAVNKLLGDRRVKALVADDVIAYIRERVTQGMAPATINRELDIIRGVLKKAKRWHMFQDEVKPLSLPESIGRALLQEEKIRLLRLAGNRKEWQTVYFAAVLAFNTTMRGCEIRHLRWRDVDLIGDALTIRHSKTKKGVRIIPLNADAQEVILKLYERAKEMGGPNPDQYLFFACERGNLDPTRPQKKAGEQHGDS
jgi:integrase